MGKREKKYFLRNGKYLQTKQFLIIFFCIFLFYSPIISLNTCMYVMCNKALLYAKILVVLQKLQVFSTFENIYYRKRKCIN